MPIPGAPMRVTSSGCRSRRTRANTSQRSSISPSRPTSDARPRSRGSAPGRERAPTACHASTGFALPFARTGSNASYSIGARRRAGRSFPRRGSRSPARQPRRRAATLTKSATIRSPRSGSTSGLTRASPVLTPTRTERSRAAADSASSAMASRIASAARTARSASSSCAAGSPKTAMTSSPMNFSTMPPMRSTCSRRTV